MPRMKQDRGDEVREVDRRLRAARGCGVIRASRLRGRLALEHLEHAVGDEEAADDVDRRRRRRRRTRAPSRGPSRPSPRSASPPTRTMPWIAFVPDISGVCSIVGTFEMISMPMKTARTKTVMLLRRAHGSRGAPAPSATWPSWVTHVSRAISSSKSSASSRRPPTRWLQERPDVARVHLARVQRHRRSGG